MRRHAPWAPILVAALMALLTAVTVTARSSAADAGGPGRDADGDPSFVVATPGVDGPLTHLTGDDRRDSGTDLLVKLRVASLVALAGLVGLAAGGRWGVLVSVTARRPAVRWRWPHVGRSPPLISSPIA